MTKKIVKNIIIGSIVLVAILGIGLYTNTIKLPITREIHVQYVADFSDDRILMGASHNVFVGKVIKQVGDKRLGETPETQFTVEVLSNIKGDLQGTIVVNQLGGYKYGMLYVVDSGDTVGPISKNTDLLLKIGTTYLFATRYNSEENWHTAIFHPNAGKVISQEGNLSTGQLQVLAGSDKKVSLLREAYKNEILLDVDIKNNNTRNSYQLLSELNKGSLFNTLPPIENSIGQ
ncbi:MAG: hypothetical protein Q7K54_01775 [Candidatus Parcubacteria bacterium]|nr:hypothetical protein [Candidatus Parcubacteria bacterium]